MTEQQKITKFNYLAQCYDYLNNLAKMLESSHEMADSCNKDKTRYLVPKGTENQITYYGKPLFSFRVSDHWNWKAPLKKCVDPHRVQCFTKDLHYPLDRVGEGRASKPILACSVGYYGMDNQYHIVCGEVYNPKTRTAEFIMKDLNEVVTAVQEDMLDYWRKSA